MFWFTFAFIAVALLAIAWWIDHTRRVHGATGDIGPLNPYGSAENLRPQNPGGGDPGGAGS